MARYIDAETALKIIDNYAKTVTEDGKAIVDAIRDIISVITPTADVVEVVRCRDCKKRYTPSCGMCYSCSVCGGQWSWETENGYCSFGEKREEREDG